MKNINRDRIGYAKKHRPNKKSEFKQIPVMNTKNKSISALSIIEIVFFDLSISFSPRRMFS